jgi:hypothetical protein
MRSQIRVHLFLVGPQDTLICLLENGDRVELELCDFVALTSLLVCTQLLLQLAEARSQTVEAPE